MNDRQVAYILGRNAPGIFEVALWVRRLRGVLLRHARQPGDGRAIARYRLREQNALLGTALELVGENVMIVSEADDLASQDRLLISPDLYRRLIKPRHHRLFSCCIKKQAKRPTSRSSITAAATSCPCCPI